MSLKTDDQLRAEAVRIMLKSGLTEDDLFFDDCPDELIDECRRYEYVREALRLDQSALKRARAGVVSVPKRDMVFSLSDAGIDPADSLVVTACRMLRDYPKHFPTKPFLTWWKSHSKQRQSKMLGNLRCRSKQLRTGRLGKVPHGIIQRIQRKFLGDAESKLSGNFELFTIAVNWNAVTSDNSPEVGRALLALKPKEFRKPPGKRESPATPLNELMAYRLLKHLTSDQAFAWLKGKPGRVSAKRLESLASRARQTLGTI